MLYRTEILKWVLQFHWCIRNQRKRTRVRGIVWDVNFDLSFSYYVLHDVLNFNPTGYQYMIQYASMMCISITIFVCACLCLFLELYLQIQGTMKCLELIQWNGWVMRHLCFERSVVNANEMNAQSRAHNRFNPHKIYGPIPDILKPSKKYTYFLQRKKTQAYTSIVKISIEITENFNDFF